MSFDLSSFSINHADTVSNVFFYSPLRLTQSNHGILWTNDMDVTFPNKTIHECRCILTDYLCMQISADWWIFYQSTSLKIEIAPYISPVICYLLITPFYFTAKQAVTFSGKQYVTWVPQTSMNSLVTDIFVRFKSNQASGIILFITGQSASEFMLLELFERTLVLKIKINGMFSFILFNFSYLSVVWISGERL